MTLIIGGSGFIGTRLCRRLSKSNSDFSIIDKKVSNSFPDKCLKIDIRNVEQLLNANCETDVLINLAAEHRDDVSPKSLYDEVNVQGARHVCEFAEKNKITTIVFTSSVAVYGFAELGTDETGTINPFNDYGRTKYEAEKIYQQWQVKDPDNRSLVIVRPTVVFGEQNRGNVYNLFNQIASKRFVMVGDGKNRKSMAYVENVAAFIEHSIKLHPGIHIFNYIDKPDYDMNTLICTVKAALGLKPTIGVRIPYWLGLIAGSACDFFSKASSRRLPLSKIRIKKFCANSVYNSQIDHLGFSAPVPMMQAIEKTIASEFK